MLEPTFDVDAYFARIGYAGPRSPTSEVLARITERHTLSIPFENLDILLGRPIRIDIASIERKLVHDRRGGYCFEHNGLLGGALRQLGFDVVSLGARARWMVPPEVATARMHMLLSVGVDRAAGFGFEGESLIDDPDELLEVLASRFRLPFPAGTRFGAPWAR